jgi:hypothetical protein
MKQPLSCLYSLLLLINATSGHPCLLDVIWCIEFHFQHARLSTRKLADWLSRREDSDTFIWLISGTLICLFQALYGITLKQMKTHSTWITPLAHLTLCNIKTITKTDGSSWLGTDILRYQRLIKGRYPSPLFLIVY